MRNRRLAAILNVIPGIGIGYLYAGSVRWFFLGILSVLALTVVDLAIGIGISGECYSGQLGFSPPCSDTQQAANERDLLLVVATTFLVLVTFNVWNAWRLAAQRNNQIQENTG